VTTVPTTPTRDDAGEKGTSRPDPRPRQHIGWIVAASLFIGLVVGLLLVAAPFIPAEESKVTGALLCGFALGWATLAVLSTRFSDQPQPWAVAPALFMGLSGLLLLAFGSSAQGVLRWIWPPVLLVLVVWMIIRSRQQLKSGSRWLLYPVFAVLLLASIGGAYETVSGALDASPYPMPGELIDVGDYRLHLSCTGSGSPTVVLQAGGGEMSSAFGWIAPAVAGETQVCVYDRAGRGWSEPAESPQDAAQISSDLHTLLDRGNIPGPYLLAGHSFGGLYVLTFAALYPDDVSGLVLIDSTAPASEAPAEATTGGNGGSYDLPGRISALLSSSARLGLGRLIAQADYGLLPPQSRDEIRASAATASYAQSTLDEYIQAGKSGRQAAALTDFSGKPLVVLTAGVGSSATWMTAQDHLATLSTNSAHHVIDGAIHAGLVHDEQYAAATTQAILDVISSVRNDTPLVGES
jgi:pimeloyl-ACP methyl ester carboxylesterase